MSARLLVGHVLDMLRALPDESVHCVVTSPPYWSLRRYDGQQGVVWGGEADCEHEWGEESYQRRSNDGGDTGRKQVTNVGAMGRDEPIGHAFCSRCGTWRGSLGLEPTIDLYVEHLVAVMRELRRVLRRDGVCFINLGDTYASGKGTCFNPGGGSTSLGQRRKKYGAHPCDRGNVSTLARAGLKPKDLCMIPARVALALQADGWWLRSMIPWLKRNPMPESVTDRPTTATEYIFLLARSARYFYDGDAVKERAIHAGRVVRYDGSQKNTNHENRTYPGATGAGEITVAAGRARRDADWWFESLRAVLDGEQGMLLDEAGESLALHVNPKGYKGAHFATFPPAMVRPCLLAGTSAKGCCPKCGAPWARVTHKTTAPHPNRWSKEADARQFDAEANEYDEPHGTLGVASISETLGWRPTCTCDAGEALPAVVLDPFAGSGTTLLVAEELGRSSIGIEISEKYANEQIRPRLGLALEAEG